MRVFVFVLGISFLIAPSACWAQGSTPEEEAIKILSLRWSSHGALSNWYGVKNCQYVLECRGRAYCAFLALRCDDMEYAGGPLAEGHFRTTDKRLVPWDCRCLDGKSGRVNIDKRQYDLAKGRLFLIIPSKEAVEVYQIHADLARMPKDWLGQLALDEAKSRPEGRTALNKLGLNK